MPHVIVKIVTGRSEAQKAAIAEAVTRALMASAGSAEANISVGIEDIAKEAWVEEVYRPDILGRAGTLYKKPGYDPL